MRQDVGNLGEFGVLADPLAQDIPANAFTRVQNVRFRDLYAERIGGLSPATPLTTPAAPPWWVQPYVTATARYWIHATEFAVYSDDGTTRTNISGAFVPTATLDDRYTGGVLSGVLIVNSGADVPQYWGGTGTLAALPGWDANWRAESLRPFKNYLVALNVTKSGTNYPYMVKWSDKAVPGAVPSSWDETDPTIDAAENDLAETPDRLVDQLLLGDMNVIYKEQSMWAMRWIGGQDIFSFQRLPGDVGAASRQCIAATPVGHVVLTYGDVILHNGQGPTSILNKRMRRWLRVLLSTDYFRRSFLVTNYATNEVWICFPETGAERATKALIWNWVDNTFGVRDLPGINHGAAGRMPVAGSYPTFDTLSGTFDELVGAFDQTENNASETRLVLAQESPGALLLADQGDSNGVAAYPAVVERTGLTFDAPEWVKTCRGLWLAFDAPVGAELLVELGGSMTPEEGATFGAPITYTVGSTLKADGFATGRYLAYRITSKASFPWRLRSVGFDLVKRGRY